MKKQCPASQCHPFAIIFFSSYLTGSYANNGSFLVVVLTASVRQVYIRLVVKEDSINTVIVQTVANRRYFLVIDDTDQ